MDLVVAAAITVAVFTGVRWLNRVGSRRPEHETASADRVICRQAPGWFCLGLLMGTAMFVVGISLAIYAVAGFGKLHVRWLASLIGFGGAFVGVYCVLGALKYRVILEPDSITLVGIFANRRLRREEITEKLELPFFMPSVMLFPVRTPRKKKKKIRIAYCYDKNQEIQKWVSDIPTLGKRTRASS